MKITLVLVIFAVICYSGKADTSVDSDYEAEWVKFKEEYNKNYPNKAEDNYRKSMFVREYKKVKANNAKHDQGLVSFRLSLNNHSDWSTLEKKDGRLRPVVPCLVSVDDNVTPTPTVAKPC